MKPQNLESAIVDKTAAIMFGNDSAVPAIYCYSLRHEQKYHAYYRDFQP